jgi:hypothetical protein
MAALGTTMTTYATNVAMTTPNANWRCRAVVGAVATENANSSLALRSAKTRNPQGSPEAQLITLLLAYTQLVADFHFRL